MPSRNASFQRLREAADRLRPRTGRLRRWLPVGIGVLIVLVIALVYLFTGGRSIERITIMTGTEGGTYFAMGQVIAEALGQADPPIEARAVKSGGAAENATTLQQIEEVRASLFAIFHEVISDLDNDRIDKESLQSFSLVWDVAQSTLSQRHMLLAGHGGGAKGASRATKGTGRL